MRLSGRFFEEWRRLGLYEKFEQIAYGILILFIALMVVHSLIFLVFKLSQDVFVAISFGETTVLQDAFGAILTVVILLEFNRSIVAAMRGGSGLVELRIVVMIVIIVIARKLILFDYGAADLKNALFMGALVLVLGALYWLLGNAERRPTKAPPEP
jgi:uncharacterized membrane protein (DUF373 family)